MKAEPLAAAALERVNHAGDLARIILRLEGPKGRQLVGPAVRPGSAVPPWKSTEGAALDVVPVLRTSLCSQSKSPALTGGVTFWRPFGPLIQATSRRLMNSAG
jgi:hypothetical protein